MSFQVTRGLGASTGLIRFVPYIYVYIHIYIYMYYNCLKEGFMMIFVLL